MKRLTKRIDGTAAPVSTNYRWIDDMMEKLAQYEDTGLEPEDVQRLREWLDDEGAAEDE